MKEPRATLDKTLKRSARRYHTSHGPRTFISKMPTQPCSAGDMLLWEGRFRHHLGNGGVLPAELTAGPFEHAAIGSIDETGTALVLLSPCHG
jgi:hypothetical protein